MNSTEHEPQLASDAGVDIVAIADAIDLVALHQRSPDRYPFLLQSTAVSRQLGGYDILFACPRERFELRELGDLDSQGGFLKTLDDRWRAEYADVDTETMPFTGGWFLYLGYELAGEIEPGLTLTPDPLLPVAFAVRCKAAVIRRHSDQACFLISEKDADVCATTVSEDIAAAVNFEYSGLPDVSPTITEEEPTIFTDAVVSAKEHISAGDIYQANLSRQWMARFADPVEPESVYRSLCTQNPGPFAGLISYDDVHVVSSSPERLLAVTGRHISTRPIAGTRPRSDNAEHDQELLEELINNPKERAEHVMLIDLERNDLGRVCEAGTVVVNENMVIESYAHVHHIVSNVEGQLRADITPGQAIAAVFPGGTITGCPKVRCMEIISELEDSPRGAYTGSFGYLNRNGDLDLNILIRTLVIHDDEVTLRAGSGIVADSEPEAELNETRAKAKGLLRALSP